jgi:transaldolase
MHWSQFIGGNVVISPPFGWQKRLNASGIEPTHRLDDPVDPRIVEDLYDNFPEFRKAYDEKGLEVSEFTEYGATARTMRQFLAANGELESFVRDVTLPNPDK